MPLVTVSNTNDPKGNVVNTPNFSGSNLPIAASSTLPAPVQQAQPVATQAPATQTTQATTQSVDLPKPGIIEIGVSPQGVTETSAPLTPPPVQPAPAVDISNNLDQKIQEINAQQNQILNSPLPEIKPVIVSDSLAQKMQNPLA